MKTHKVMMVVPSAQVGGGGDVWFSELLEVLSPDNIQLIIVFENYGELVTKAESKGHKVYVLSSKRYQRQSNFINLAISLANVILLEELELIIHWTPRAHVYGTLAQFISCKKIKTGWVQHVIPSRYWLHRLASWCPAKIVFCVSSAVAKKQKSLYPKTNPIIIHPGTSKQEYYLERQVILNKYRIDTNKFIIGLLARVEPWKGQDILVSAIAILKKQGISIHLLLVGKETSKTWPDFPGYVRRLIDQNHINEIVTFTGHIENIQNIIHAFDILVCASREEGFGISILDAMKSGIPVIATRCGGPEDIISNNKNGFLVESENPIDLASAIQTIFENPDLVKRFISEGKLTYQNNFTASHTAMSFLKIIYNLLGS